MSADRQWPGDERHELALVLERNVTALLLALRASEATDREAGTALALLLAACTAGDAIEEATSFAVAQARAAGNTWQQIGEVLAITRQAAQQRFSAKATNRDTAGDVGLAHRAGEIVEQIDRGEWKAVTADWTGTMRSGLPVKRLKSVWRELIATAGPLQGVGRPTIKQRGPFRVAELPLVFEHGPMRAQVTFDHDGLVAGLFLTLPDETGVPHRAGG